MCNFFLYAYSIMVSKKTSKRKRVGQRAGQLSQMDIQAAIQMADNLSAQLKLLQLEQTPISNINTNTNTNTSDVYGLESSMLPATTNTNTNTNTNMYPLDNNVQDYLNMPPVPLDTTFKTTARYSTPGSRVSLTYPRIIQLLQSNSNNPKKATALAQLQNATNQQEVQNIINNNGLKISNNYIGGKTRKNNKNRKTNKTTKTTKTYKY
jgi:hypothetical protein